VVVGQADSFASREGEEEEHEEGQYYDGHSARNLLRKDAANLLSVGKPSTLLAKCWEIFCPAAMLRAATQAGPFLIS
jgi:hypothetical protein